MTDQNLDFSTQATSGKLAKLFTRKLLSYNMPAKLNAILCNQVVFIINVCVGFIHCMPDRVFS